jgi:hypothetical protein
MIPKSAPAAYGAKLAGKRSRRAAAILLFNYKQTGAAQCGAEQKGRIRMPSPSRIARLAASVCFAWAVSGSPLHAADAVTQTVNGNRIEWSSTLQNASARLRLMAPNGTVSEQRFADGKPSLTIDPATAAPGGYGFEVQFIEAASGVKTRPVGGSAALGAEPNSVTRSGAFRIAGGVLYAADGGQEPSSGTANRADTPVAPADVVNPDDVIVQGSLCVGFDCVNNESFGFDTVRLKENNLRIKFEDTSNTGAYPTRDWQLVANDSANGGAERFSIEDVTAARVPFTLMGDAPANSLFIAANGKLGLRTSTPGLDLHMQTGDTPAIRFEQNGTGGFTPQTWDIGANEANFFVRDYTIGSTLPFRIRAGAPTSSIDINTAGQVGIGTSAPAAALHVYRGGGSAMLRVEETNGSSATRTLVDLRNTGAPRIAMSDTLASTGWDMTGGSAFTVAASGAGTPQLSLAANGNLNITGTLSQGSSVTLKENLVPVRAAELLDALQRLPIYTWNYRQSDSGDRHLGPTAEDFHRLFGLGNNDKAIAPGDMAGIALGAVQWLSAALAEKERALQALQARLDALEARLAKDAR